MRKAHDILIDGRPEMILWAENQAEAVAEAKRILFWDKHPEWHHQTITAAPRIYES